MHLTDTFSLSSTSNLSHSQATALHYGFHPLSKVTVTTEDKQKAEDLSKRHCPSISNQDEHGPMCEKVWALRSLLDTKKPLEKTLMISYLDTAPRSRPDYHRLSLDIFGSREALSEALTIQAAVSVLEEHGIKKTTVHINSLGDEESFRQFSATLKEYCRTHIAHMSPSCQEMMKATPVSLYLCKCEGCQELREEAPRPMFFLSEESRKRFMEILEYLEELSVSYVVDETLMGPRHHTSETVYEIRTKEGEVVGCGGRQDRLVSKLGFRRELPHVEVSLFYNKNRHKQSSKVVVRRLAQPDIFYVHLGYEARLKSLPIIEKLRQQGVYMRHFLTETTCRNQVALAEKQNARYLFIMGIKEALENSILIRDMYNHSQQAIPLSDLSRRVRRLKITA